MCYHLSRDMVIGLVGNANNLVVNAMRHDVSLTYVTSMLIALHRKSSMHKWPGYRSEFVRHNKRFLDRFNSSNVLTTTLQFVTRFARYSDNRVTVVLER